MAILDSKYHIKINGYGFVLARGSRTERPVYGREEAPNFVNKFGSGDPNYRDSTFFPHWVQNNWLNGFDQEKFNDPGKFYRSSQIDPTVQEKLTLEKAVSSIGTIGSGEVTAFGQRSSSSQGWWDTDYGYRQQITITAPALQSVPVGYPVKISIDTAALQTASKVRSDRKDWRVIYANGTSFVDLGRDYINTTTTFFAVQSAISAGQSDSNYYVYYGYASESTTKQPSTEAEWNAVYAMYGVTPDANSKAIIHMREGSGTSLADDSPTGTNTGTTTGTPVWAEDGKFGRYLNFNGSSMGIDLGSGSDFELGSFTLEAWVNLSAPNSNLRLFMRRKSGATGDDAYSLDDFGTNLRGNVNGSPTVAFYSSGVTVNDSAWHHVAFTYDGVSSGKLYIDGVEKGSTVVGGATPVSVNKFLIANNGNADGTGFASGTQWQGKLQHVRISNVQRTSFPYALTSDPSIGTGTETAQAALPAGGTFEVYAGNDESKIYLYDGTATWTEVFDTRRLTWYDTVASVDTNYNVGDIGGTEYAAAQGFQLLADTKISAIQTYIKKNNGTPGDITVRIETNNAGVPSGTLANAGLTATIPAFTTTSFDWVTVTFATPISLSAATTYWIVFKTAAAANDNSYYIGSDGSSPTYASGTAASSTNGGSTWSADSAKDLMFRVLGEETRINQFTQATFSGNTNLYVAVGTPSNTNNGNGRIYKYDGSTWTLNKAFTGAGSAAVLCLQVYESKLYAGLSPTAAIQVTSDGSTWASSKDIDQPDNPGFVYDMEVYNGRLYACGGHPEYDFTTNSGGFLWSFDNFSWTFIYDFGFTVIKSLGVFDSLLFLGSIKKRLYVYNTASMDKLIDFPEEMSINSLVVHEDKLAIGLGATNSLTGGESVYYFDRNGFSKAFVPAAVGINALISTRNQLIMGTTSTTVYKASANTYHSSGYVQSSYFEASLPSIDKLWRSVILHYSTMPAGCSILVEYKTDESNASWTTLGTADDANSLTEEFTFPVAFYSKKLSLKITLSTSNPSVTPELKIVDTRYVIAPDLKYLWKMTIACPDNLVWADGTQPRSLTAEAITAGETALDLDDAGGFPTQGRATLYDGGVADEFTWTGKTGNTLTGIPATGDDALGAHSSTDLEVKITGGNLHKLILDLKTTKSLYTFTDIDGEEYTIHFNGYQPDNFLIGNDGYVENNVPITLLQV